MLYISTYLQPHLCKLPDTSPLGPQVIGPQHYLGETMLPTMTPGDEQLVPVSMHY